MLSLPLIVADSPLTTAHDNLQTLSWFDPETRLIKRDGETLEKIVYDRIGRVTKRFVLASDNDSVYGDADDVSGDVVLEEDHTLYDASDGKVIFQARIDRNWNDSGISQNTGALDTNADADDLLYTASNLKGRIQITAIWNGLQEAAFWGEAPRRGTGHADIKRHSPYRPTLSQMGPAHPAALRAGALAQTMDPSWFLIGAPFSPAGESVPTPPSAREARVHRGLRAVDKLCWRGTALWAVNHRLRWPPAHSVLDAEAQ